ncbi:hypothetical protein [Baekduia sp. Peel2402]|uniref:hypothetical protein n=1 Tax=Baekduia sp. Peel2402 TaxID=3458296 RepID=UPI00403E3E7F
MDRHEMMADELMGSTKAQQLRLGPNQGHPVAEALRGLVPIVEEWFVTTKGNVSRDNPNTFLAIGDSRLFRVRYFDHPAGDELGVEPVPMEHVRVVSCVQTLYGLPRRTWQLNIPGDGTFEIKTDLIGDDVKDADERFVRLLADAQGWEVGPKPSPSV